MKFIKLTNYTIPMYGNKKGLPCGRMLVQHDGEEKEVKFGEIDEQGRKFITFNRKRYYFKNEGSLYSPRFVFEDEYNDREQGLQDEANHRAENKTFIALYCNTATRDAQICKVDPESPEAWESDDGWEDLEDAEVFIGIFTGASEEEVEANVVSIEGCHENAIKLIPIGNSENT